MIKPPAITKMAPITFNIPGICPQMRYPIIAAHTKERYFKGETMAPAARCKDTTINR